MGNVPFRGDKQLLFTLQKPFQAVLNLQPCHLSSLPQIQQFIQDLSDIWAEVRKKDIQSRSMIVVVKDV